MQTQITILPLSATRPIARWLRAGLGRHSVRAHRQIRKRLESLIASTDVAPGAPQVWVASLRLLEPPHAPRSWCPPQKVRWGGPSGNGPPHLIDARSVPGRLHLFGVAGVVSVLVALLVRVGVGTLVRAVFGFGAFLCSLGLVSGRGAGGVGLGAHDPSEAGCGDDGGRADQSHVALEVTHRFLLSSTAWCGLVVQECGAAAVRNLSPPETAASI